MEDRTVTLKQLYQYVDEYFAEAKAEGFDPQVGDFVDWIACQEGEAASRMVQEENERRKQAIKKMKELGPAFPHIKDPSAYVREMREEDDEEQR